MARTPKPCLSYAHPKNLIDKLGSRQTGFIWFGNGNCSNRAITSLTLRPSAELWWCRRNQRLKQKEKNECDIDSSEVWRSEMTKKKRVRRTLLLVKQQDTKDWLQMTNKHPAPQDIVCFNSSCICFQTLATIHSISSSLILAWLYWQSFRTPDMPPFSWLAS